MLMMTYIVILHKNSSCANCKHKLMMKQQLQRQTEPLTALVSFKCRMLTLKLCHIDKCSKTMFPLYVCELIFPSYIITTSFQLKLMQKVYERHPHNRMTAQQNSLSYISAKTVTKNFAQVFGLLS
jgi:hypothetical protein